jgi:hypothetical protein
METETEQATNETAFEDDRTIFLNRLREDQNKTPKRGFF